MPTYKGRFMIRTQGESVFYVCTKFQADSSVQKLLGVLKFRN